jgi:hypothetical protein
MYLHVLLHCARDWHHLKILKSVQNRYNEGQFLNEKYVKDLSLERIL